VFFDIERSGASIIKTAMPKCAGTRIGSNLNYRFSEPHSGRKYPKKSKKIYLRRIKPQLEYRTCRKSENHFDRGPASPSDICGFAAVAALPDDAANSSVYVGLIQTDYGFIETP